MSLRIIGTGRDLPERLLTNGDLAKMVDTSDEWIFEHTGIRERRICEPGENICRYAHNAAQKAMDDAGIAPEKISLIICSTTVGATSVPNLATTVMREIGACCPAFDINVACSGFLYALKIADSMLVAGTALVICAEQLSRFTDYADRRTNVLFGDGAACVALEKGEGLRFIDVFAAPDPAGALHCPPLNHRDENGNLVPSYLFMDGQEVFKFATREMMRLVRLGLSETGLDPEDIKLYIPHQANVRIIQSCAQRIGMPIERFYINIDRYGNTSSATIPIALDELRRDGKLSSGDTILLAAFGGGWTSGCAVWTV